MAATALAWIVSAAHRGNINVNQVFSDGMVLQTNAACESTLRCFYPVHSGLAIGLVAMVVTLLSCGSPNRECCFLLCVCMLCCARAIGVLTGDSMHAGSHEFIVNTVHG